MEAEGQRYSVLKKTQVREKMMKKIDQISEVCSLSKSDATLILILLKWNSKTASDLTDALQKNNEGRELISCLNQDCVAPVGLDLIKKIPEPVREVYHSYTLQSFMEANKDTIKWCPAPGCSYAIELHDNNVEDNSAVVCSCGHIFCWTCQLESHRPVTCNIASLWCNDLLNQARNVSWIHTNTKACPDCHNPVEKNDDDPDHRVVTCPMCSYGFCWVCLRTHAEHNGIWNCDAVALEAPVFRSPTELTQIHFLKLWDEGDKLLEKAKSRLRGLEEKTIPKLVRLTQRDITVVREAAILLVRCIQVLKWSRLLGYFISEFQIAKKQHLKDQLSEARTILREHEWTLYEVIKEAREDKSDPNLYMGKLVTSTSSTGKYFHRFIKHMEDGMPGVKDDKPFKNGHCICARCKFQNVVVDKVFKRSFIDKKVCMRCFLPLDTPPGVVSANNSNFANVSEMHD